MVIKFTYALSRTMKIIVSSIKITFAREFLSWNCWSGERVNGKYWKTTIQQFNFWKIFESFFEKCTLCRKIIRKNFLKLQKNSTEFYKLFEWRLENFDKFVFFFFKKTWKISSKYRFFNSFSLEIFTIYTIFPNFDIFCWVYKDLEDFAKFSQDFENSGQLEK